MQNLIPLFQSRPARLLLLVASLGLLGLALFMAIHLHWISIGMFCTAAWMLHLWWRAHTTYRSTDWPAQIPRLYPHLDGVALCEFMTAADFARIRDFPIVKILPLTNRGASAEDTYLGRGLQFLLMRDLMLVRNLSITGPEDTPIVFMDSAPKVAQAYPYLSLVTGKSSHTQDGFRLDVSIFRPGQKWIHATIVSASFEEFLLQCAATITHILGGRTDPTVLERWRVARPKSAQSLTQFGQIMIDLKDDAQAQGAALWELSRADRGFGLPLAMIDSDVPNYRAALLESFRRDPFNAQTCFALYIHVWTGQAWQPSAMQFIRRALELSPGHGKAHMCAPHAAHLSANMLGHSELGYRLLPGNAFAVNNYILYLTDVGAPPEKIIELAREGIDNDPLNPGSHERLIELLCASMLYHEALAAAERLQELLEPPIHDRTWYCLRQNPKRAQSIDAGQYDPGAENRSRLQWLRSKCGYD